MAILEHNLSSANYNYMATQVFVQRQRMDKQHLFLYPDSKKSLFLCNPK